MSRPDDNSTPHQGKTADRDGFTNSHLGHVHEKFFRRGRISSILDTVDAKSNSEPTVSRQMGNREVAQSEPGEENRRNNAVLRQNSGRDRDDLKLSIDLFVKHSKI